MANQTETDRYGFKLASGRMGQKANVLLYCSDSNAKALDTVLFNMQQQIDLATGGIDGDLVFDEGTF